MAYDNERAVAVAALREAASLCVNVRRDMVTPEAIEKGDRSPVTIADLGAQAIVCRRLREAFPADPIVAEEDSAELRGAERGTQLESVVGHVRALMPEATGDDVCSWIDAGGGAVADRYWTLDPIDGTKGFLRNDQYAVALALFEDGELKVGVLACPALPLSPAAGAGNSSLFVAVRGQGASVAALGSDDFHGISVTGSDDPSRRRFVESVEAAHGDQALQEAVARAVGIETTALRMDSQAKYGAVARGDATLYLRLPSPKSPDYREKIWDHAAGTIIVEEAGGRVTDMHGKPLDFSRSDRLHDNRGVVVSNGYCHDSALAALANGPA